MSSRLSIAIAIVAMVATSCASEQIVNAGEQGENPVDQPEIASVVADLSPCDDALELSPGGALSVIERWVELEKTENLEFRDGQNSWVSMSIREVVAETAQEVDVLVHPDQKAGLEWGMSNPGTVYLGVQDWVGTPGALSSLIVLHVLPSGNLFFSGLCSQKMHDGWLSQAIGEDYSKTFVRDVVSKSGSDLRSSIGFDEVGPAAVQEQPRDLLLNPSSVDPRLLESLNSVIVFHDVRETVSDATICSSTRLSDEQTGWNDCFSASERGVIWMESFVGSDGLLEFHMFNAQADFAGPRESLGFVDLRSSFVESDDTLAVEVVILPSREVQIVSVTDLDTYLVENSIPDGVTPYERDAASR